MKKGLSIFFLIYYLIFSFGFVVNKHYCKGELVSLEIMAPAESCCGDTENTCCSTDQDIIFLDDHNQTVQTISLVQPVILLTQMLAHNDGEHVLVLEKENWNSTADPPLLNKIPKYLINCSLVIYS